MIASPEVESIRAEIPATTLLIYLNTGWQGPSPRSVIDAVEFVQGIGLEAVRARALELARYATGSLAHVPDVRLVSPSSEEAVTSGLVSFSLPNLPPEVVTACLWERGRIVARTVPDAKCTRFCLHVFNTETEVDEALTIVDDLARSGLPAGEFPSIALEQEAMTEL